MSNYSRGANLERAVQKDLERIGYDTIRAAGSHGAADIWASFAGFALFIQCKTDGYIGPVDKEELIELARRNKGKAFLAFRSGKRGIEYKCLSPPT